MKDLKTKKIIIYAVNIILLMILTLVLYIGHYIERPKNNALAEEAMRRAVVSIDQNQQQQENKAIIADEKTLMNPGQNDDSCYVGIVLTNLGLNEFSNNIAISLPAEITLGFSPYGNNLDQYISDAAIANHELLIHVPMETNQLNDPNNLAIISNNAATDNENRLLKLLNIHEEISGVYTDMQEQFTQDLSATKHILETLAKNKKIFVYGSKTPNKLLLEEASKSGLSIISRDITIDDANEQTIHESLANLEKLAIERKSVVAYIDSITPITHKILIEWFDSLKTKNIKLVAISKLVK